MKAFVLKDTMTTKGAFVCRDTIKRTLVDMAEQVNATTRDFFAPSDPSEDEIHRLGARQSVYENRLNGAEWTLAQCAGLTVIHRFRPEMSNGISYQTISALALYWSATEVEEIAVQ